ncbi:MAG TPA: chitin deacetylase [Fuerstia sp.]|nr:chitin deacetylase [Fuerstiella sp.]
MPSGNTRRVTDYAVNSRRTFLAASAASLTTLPALASAGHTTARKAQIAITFDLEMSRQYPTRDMMEWDFQKGNLNDKTKQYSLQAAQRVHERGGLIHFFCVGRVLEQPDVDWLRQIVEMGHPVGNHTYDHVNIWTTDVEKVQFRFQRSPWLVAGKSVEDIVQENIRLASAAMKQRLGVTADGFRSPGGSHAALNGREDLQQMLLSQGFEWVSSGYPSHKYGKPQQPPGDDVYRSIVDAMKSAQPYRYPTGLVEIPMSPISDVGAFRTSRWKREYFLKSIEQCIEWAIANGGVFDFLCHPSIMYVEDPGFEVVDHICNLVKSAGDAAELVSLSTIASRVP